jgi:deazaflavin-dependent oxidoreductase (nitroreductase family)
VKRFLNEQVFFRALNRVAEPLVRAGIGSPRMVPSGFIVLETRGRRTGRLRRVPLAATRFGGFVLVGTFRGSRSEWVRNLIAEPRARFWLGGRPRTARAFVLHRGRRLRPPGSLPLAVQGVLWLLLPYTRMGWAFAVLSPRPRSSRNRC